MERSLHESSLVLLTFREVDLFQVALSLQHTRSPAPLGHLVGSNAILNPPNHHVPWRSNTKLYSKEIGSGSMSRLVNKLQHITLEII